MPRKKGGTIGTKTLIVRLSEQLDGDLRVAAEGLGIDVSNLVRMILIEHVPTYIERGLDAQRRAQSARVQTGNAGSAKRKPRAKLRPEDGEEDPQRSLDL